MLPSPLTRLLPRLRRRVLAHRRLLAALLAAVAVAAGLRTLAPPAPATVPLTVAARDLPAGRSVSAHDVTTTDVPRRAVPDGTVADVLGAVLAAPLRRGEPITDARLVGPSLTLAHPGLVALPLRLPDAAMAGLLEPGDRIDLYAVAPSTGDLAGGTGGPAPSTGAARVGDDVLVLALPPPSEQDSGGDGLGGRLVVAGVPPAAVARLADASARSFLTFAFVH